MMSSDLTPGLASPEGIMIFPFSSTAVVTTGKERSRESNVVHVSVMV